MFCKKKLHNHIAKKEALLVSVLSAHPPCISVCFSLILTVVASGKKCNAFSACAQYKTRILDLKKNNQTNKKTKPKNLKQAQLPGLNY